MKAVLVTIICLLVACIARALDDSVCPYENGTGTCPCNARSGNIRCSGLRDPSALINALKRFAGRSFQELMIDSASLQYIPHEIFEEIRFKRLYVNAGNFIDLFDQPPRSRTILERIHIERSAFRGISWKNLKPFTNLNELSILVTPIRELDQNFGNSLPKSLKHLTLSRTSTTSIRSGAFRGLENIEILQVKDAELSSLTRDMFPTPFNAEKLSFSRNKLMTLSKGLFSQMPKLNLVDLRVNKLSEIPEDAFGETRSQLDTLLLDNNPLNCDCILYWLVKNGPKKRSGICKSPFKMQGKRLAELTTADFNC